MHPSQLTPFRKTIIALLTIAFAGSLMVFTGQANLDLLKSIYPNPQFYMFGLFALEGGILYWTGYYLLHLAGAHKGIALVALAVDTLLSGVGFFYEMERNTNSVGTIPLPSVTVIIGFAVAFNIVMSLITHLLPYEQYHEPQDYDYVNTPLPRPIRPHRGPGLLASTVERAKDSVLGARLESNHAEHIPVVDGETAVQVLTEQKKTVEDENTPGLSTKISLRRGKLSPLER